MREYDFALVATYQDAVTADKACDIANELFSAGAEDCTVITKGNAIIIEFDREAESYEQALISAIKNVNAVNGLNVKSVDEGQFVSLSDAAELSHLTRSALSKFSKGTRGDGKFPSPCLKANSKAPLYEWKEVSSWLAGRDLIDTSIAVNAAITAKMNMALILKNGEFEGVSGLAAKL